MIDRLEKAKLLAIKELENNTQSAQRLYLLLNKINEEKYQKTLKKVEKLFKIHCAQRGKYEAIEDIEEGLKLLFNKKEVSLKIACQNFSYKTIKKYIKKGISKNLAQKNESTGRAFLKKIYQNLDKI